MICGTGIWIRVSVSLFRLSPYSCLNGSCWSLDVAGGLGLWGS